MSSNAGSERMDQQSVLNFELLTRPCGVDGAMLNHIEIQVAESERPRQRLSGFFGQIDGTGQETRISCRSHTCLGLASCLVRSLLSSATNFENLPAASPDSAGRRRAAAEKNVTNFTYLGLTFARENRNFACGRNSQAALCICIMPPFHLSEGDN